MLIPPFVVRQATSTSDQRPATSWQLPPRPNDALVGSRHRADAFVRKLLEPLSFVRFRRVDVALRVRRDAVHREELTRLTTAIAEARDDLERGAIHHVHALVLAVGEEDIFLLRVA